MIIPLLSYNHSIIKHIIGDIKTLNLIIPINIL